jgi:hypothetical protein
LSVLQVHKHVFGVIGPVPASPTAAIAKSFFIRRWVSFVGRNFKLDETLKVALNDKTSVGIGVLPK